MSIQEIARVFFGQIKLKPEKFGLTTDIARNITEERMVMELQKYLDDGTDKDLFIAKIFDAVIRELINSEYVTDAKTGNLVSIEDYEKKRLSKGNERGIS